MLKIYSFLAVIILLVNCTGTEPPTTAPIPSQPTRNLEGVNQTTIPPTTSLENNYIIDQEVFINAHTNNILPDELLREVYYFGGGGGGGDQCFYTNYSSPRVEEVKVFWPFYISFLTCGWDFDANKNVEIRLISQDGEEVVNYYQMQELNTYGDSTVLFEHSLSLNDLFDVYQVEVNVATETLRFSVNVQGSIPIIYRLQDKNGDLTHLILVYFEPNEQVDILFYTQKANDTLLLSFQQKNTYKTDSKGNLIIELNGTKSENEIFEPQSYFAIGNVSGEAYPLVAKYTDSIYDADVVDLRDNYDEPIHILNSKQIRCENALPTQLSLALKAKVVTNHLNVRESPSIHAETVKHTSLSQNRIITILEGPICSNGYIWWKGDSGEITLSDGSTGRLVGWMVEADDKERYLEPVEP